MTRPALIAAREAAAYARGVEDAAKVADNHEHAPDDFICGGLNCGTIIAAGIRALTPSAMPKGER